MNLKSTPSSLTSPVVGNPSAFFRTSQGRNRARRSLPWSAAGVRLSLRSAEAGYCPVGFRSSFSTPRRGGAYSAGRQRLTGGSRASRAARREEGAAGGEGRAAGRKRGGRRGRRKERGADSAPVGGGGGGGGGERTVRSRAGERDRGEGGGGGGGRDRRGGGRARRKPETAGGPVAGPGRGVGAAAAAERDRGERSASSSPGAAAAAGTRVRAPGRPAGAGRRDGAAARAPRAWRPQPSVGGTEPSHIPPGIPPRNAPLSLRALEACVGCLFPGVEFWLSTPCLDICYSLLVDILSQSEKPRPKFLASPVFRSTCSDAGFPGTLRVCSGRPSAC
ncbi:uncharacterized protein [Macaca fascicularis]|uniref:uncharacterized protein n=1 Tax=Macaca fascicularis TaxID=9541 RepID=UPI003D153FF2